jgi:murein L,D-transpeptidase YcbB/YkuD
LGDPLGNKYWIRQKYGRGNALGQVKFLFPNNYRVYLHDTPSKKLFKRSYRAYSHGCVRIENPAKLAQYLIDNYTSSSNHKKNINSIIRTRKRNVIELPIGVPIHIQYLTCMGNDNGEMVFYPDIYKRDEAQIKELFKNQGRI